MNPHPALEKFINWLLNNSLQAGLLVLLVLLVQFAFKRQLAHRWRFLLWWVVVLRLALPFAPASAVSLFNFFKPAVRLEGPRYSASAEPAPAPSATAVAQIPLRPSAVTPNESLRAENEPVSPGLGAPASRRRVDGENQKLAGGTPALPGAVPHLAVSFDDVLIPGLAAVWLAGVLAFSGCLGIQLLRFRKKLSRCTAASDPDLLELLADCRREFGVTRKIELLETDAVNSPALTGLLRLRLLLPRGLAEKFSARELRYIFLHELAHVQRGDLWLNWLVTALQIIHWFNPLVWFGFARLRADRELACDELALVRAGETTGTSYGETIIKLLEGLGRPKTIPGLIGILEDKKQMRRRISMIANFRRPGRWSALAVILFAAVAAAALTDAQTEKPSTRSSRGNEAQISNPESRKQKAESSQSLLPPSQNSGATSTSAAANSDAARPDLTGAVHAKGGAALAASVFIATAAPKTGTSVFCPSCYADCRKSATADAEGNFKIEALDPQLTFQVLAVAKGFKPKYVGKVDPAKGPVNIELSPIESADAAPDRSLRGRVVNAKGEPVEGAAVEMVGIESRDGGGSYGQLPGIDPLAVTDGNGEFLLTAQKPFDMMDVKVTARTFADKGFHKLPSGKLNELVLTEGATITGRVLRDGQPVPGVSIGISGVERQSGIYVGHFEVGTDKDGDFALVNIPPDVDFWIYGIMDTMRNHGAIPIQKIHSGKDGQTTEAGKLVIGPAHRLAGRVVLDDGAAVPAKTRLLISREAAWDTLRIVLGKDGEFDTTGIPSETISLSVRVKGYHVSGQNVSIEAMNRHLLGRVNRDVTNLVYLLDKGPEPQPNYNPGSAYDWPGERPLRGAEGGVDHSRDWKISGRVIDHDTKEPVANFHITPGQADNIERTSWDTTHAVDGKDGAYLVYVSKRFAQPLLKVEADGYLPANVTLPSRDATNVDFVLTKGNGPSGTVLVADGNPAAGATVVLLGADYNQVSFNSKGELTAYWNKAILRRTDTNGHFAFKPEWGTKSLAAASSNGFAMVSVEALATNSTVKLEAFGKITGTLNRTAGWGTNEDLDVSFTGTGPGGRSFVNLNLHTATDSQGRFEFERVPPGKLRISYREQLPAPNANSWTSVPLREVELKSGQSLEVNIETTDRTARNEFAGQQPPQPSRIAGAEIKGVVLTPDGKPAAEAEVALQVEGKYLALGKGTFARSGLREEGLLVTAGADGSFTLPLYEKAQSVIALNEEGFAQVSLEQLKISPPIKLQKWGRIEGTLEIRHHPGTNEQVVLSVPPSRWSKMRVQKMGQGTNHLETTNASAMMLNPVMYDFNAFVSRTDDHGRFAISYVPPGEQAVARLVSTGGGSQMHRPLGNVTVNPGATVVTNFNLSGRIVTGTLKFTGTNPPPDFQNAHASLHTSGAFKLMKRLAQLKTAEERKAFLKSDEAQAFQKGFPNEVRDYPGTVNADGSFRVEDVPAGKYEFGFENFSQRAIPAGTRPTSLTMYLAPREIGVPAAPDQTSDAAVDCGMVELEELTMPIDLPPAGAN